MLGLQGRVQQRNASLALALSRHFLASIDRNKPKQRSPALFLFFSNLKGLDHEIEFK
jgi:hypothetical protein